ncbi:MAG: transcription antitermination factor NusB [Gemmataceae bacterium]
MIRKRTQAREVALQLLFQHDLNPTVSREDVLRLAREQLDEDDALRFALALYDGTRERMPEIDERLSRAAENWRLPRMATIDRNVLRLGAYELDDPETPANVTLNEAIELARKYGSADSPAFVNGVLDRLHKERMKDEGGRMKSEEEETPTV